MHLQTCLKVSFACFLSEGACLKVSFGRGKQHQVLRRCLHHGHQRVRAAARGGTVRVSGLAHVKRDMLWLGSCGTNLQTCTHDVILSHRKHAKKFITADAHGFFAIMWVDLLEHRCANGVFLSSCACACTFVWVCLSVQRWIVRCWRVHCAVLACAERTLAVAVLPRTHAVPPSDTS